MSLSSGDIEKISIDKSLAGKVPDPINKGVYHIMFVIDHHWHMYSLNRVMCLLGRDQFMNSSMTEQVDSPKANLPTIRASELFTGWSCAGGLLCNTSNDIKLLMNQHLHQ